MKLNEYNIENELGVRDIIRPDYIFSECSIRREPAKRFYNIYSFVRKGGLLRELTLLLLSIAIAAFLIGIALIAGASEQTDFNEVYSTLQRYAIATLQEEPWRAISFAAAAAACVSALLNAFETRLRVTLPPQPELGDYDGAGVRRAVAEVGARVQELVKGPNVNVILAFDELLSGAISVRASDIHVTPTPVAVIVTYRVHGTLYEVVDINPDVAPRLAVRIKVLAGLETFVRGKPQDGRLIARIAGKTVEARVSTLPTEAGERIVLRLIEGSRPVIEIANLGFSADVETRLTRVLSNPGGLLFVSGPVGSGKTTTLYSCLQHISETRGRTTSIVTIENPIELKLPFATQSQINEKAGNNFASTLRSVLRQDPNVLMVGEVRDGETAEIAASAGLTGQLILTTVHAESAAATFSRLLDIGVEPHILASATAGCLSQRLVRTLCTACRQPVEPSEETLARFNARRVVIPPQVFYQPVGCENCELTGFTGRRPIAELLTMSPTISQAVKERQTTGEIFDLAVREGMTQIVRDGLAVAARGETSLDEVLRVAG